MTRAGKYIVTFNNIILTEGIDISKWQKEFVNRLVVSSTLIAF